MNQVANSSGWIDVLHTLPVMLAGLKYTVVISLASMLASLVIGLLITAARLSSHAPLRVIGFAYVQLFRAFSTYVYILFIYFGLAAFFRIDISPVNAAILALSLLNSAYISEIYRSAIESADRGIHEAAICTGLTRTQAFVHATLPQAARIALPSLVNQFVVILRDSSIVGVIGVADIMFVASKAASVRYLQFEYYTAVACVFVLLVFAISKVGDYFERKLAPP
jgi:His/Glu/Gln/Arg/opine family amino acid ABC transporter permease subunit